MHGPERVPPIPPAPPRGSDYGPVLDKAEHVVNSPEWEATARRPHVPRAEGSSGAALFPSDPRAAYLLLNEARYRAIQGVFGVRRDQANLMTLVAAMMLAEAVHARTQRLRRAMRRPSRADALLADGLLNALGAEMAGPYAREVPFFAVLIGAAAVGSVGSRVVRRSARDVKDVSRQVIHSLRYLSWRPADLVRRSAPSP